MVKESFVRFYTFDETLLLATFVLVYKTNTSNKQLFLLYRHECFTGKHTICKIHKNYIRDPSALFSKISHVSLSMM